MVILEEKLTDELAKLPEQMDELSVVDNLIAHSAAGVWTGATLATLVANVKQLAETAGFVADVTKCVAV